MVLFLNPCTPNFQTKNKIGQDYLANLTIKMQLNLLIIVFNFTGVEQSSIS